MGLGLGGGIFGSIRAATVGAVILLFLIRLIKRA
ncbi:GlsB/YeaQ/YmgE family stress response membrane protein [Tabrizicola sp.]